jgi:hypothetical protein
LLFPFVVMFCSKIHRVFLFLMFHSFVPHSDSICSFALALVPLKSYFVPWSLYFYSSRCSAFRFNLFLRSIVVSFCSHVLFQNTWSIFVPYVPQFCCLFRFNLFLRASFSPFEIMFCSVVSIFCSSCCSAFRFNLFLRFYCCFLL